MTSRGGEKRGGSEGSPKPTVSAMRKTPSVGSVRSQKDQLSLSYRGDRWSSDSSWLSDSAGSDSEHVEGALDQPQHDVRLEDLCELHRAARSGDVPGVERVLAPGDPGVNKRDRKESLRHLIPKCKMEQSPESLPPNNNPDWHPTNLTVSDKTCQKSKILNVDDQCPSVSPSMPENQSATKELRQMNLTEQEKMNVSGNDSLRDLCQSQLPENKESKEAEQDLELTSEEEQERLKGHENKQPQKMSQETEMAKDSDREDIPVYSILPHAQKSEEMWIEQDKLEWKNKLKLVTNELKQRFGEIRETYKIPVCPEEEPLLDNSMRKTHVKDIPFNLTNNIPGCVEEDASEVSVSVVFETFPEQNEPSLKSIIHPYSHPYSGSLEHACQSSSKLHLHENKLDCDSDNKPGIEHIFSMDENFSNDAGIKKARNPEEVTVEMKEGQEFDLQMTKNMNQNSDSCSTNNYKSLKPKLENLSSLPPDSDRTSEVYLHEELQQDMQKPETEVDRVEEMFLALKKENVQLQKEVEEEVEKHSSNSTELSGNPAHGAAAGNNDDGLNQQFPRKKKKGRDRPADKTSNEKNKVKNQVHPEADFADSVGPSETASEDCELSHSTYENFLLLIEQLGMECKDSVSLSRIQDTFCFYEHLLKVKNIDYEQLTVKIKQTENTVSVLQKELRETKKTELQLELQKIELEKQLYSLRLALKQEKEEKGNAVMLYNKYSEPLRLKEEECGKEVETKQRLKWTLRRLVKELKTVRNNLDLVVQERNDVQKQLSEEQNARILQDQILTSKQKELEIAQKKINSEISHRHKKEKDLLHENCMLQEEIALLRLEIDTVNNQNQQKEKKYFEDIEVVKEKNDNLQKIIKLNEEKLTETILQYSGQLNDLTAENKILSSELENEKQNQERLEIEMESYRCRLAAALHDCDQSQTSRDPKLDFQRTRQEWIHLQDKKKVDMSDLQAKTEILSEKLSNAESKISSLQIQLHNTRDAVERKSLILERLQRDLSQTHCEKKKIEQMYQTEQRKLKESVEERLSQLQSENTLLPQQLDDAHKKANSQEKTISTIQDQFHAFAKNLQAESEKKILSLQEKNKELMDEYNHLQERMHQCEKEKARRKVDLIEAQETAPSRCLHLDAENEVLQLQQTLFSMKAIQKQCETLQKNKKQLKREVVNLKSYMERNMLECVEAEQHKLLIKEKAKKEIAEKLNEAILTLQKQAAVSQEQLAQLREDNTTSVKTQMELTIKNLESEISRINTSSADFNKTELERYKELYLEEVKVRESLSNELNRTNEKIAEVSAQLTVEKELTRSPFAACSTRPILEPPCAGNLNDSEDLNRKHIPRKKKSAPESMESYLLKMQQKLQNDITTEVTAATKCEPEPYVASPPESAYQKNLNQDPVLEATKEYVQILSRKYMI
ncbi:PREDICTED: putative coiled-coil domain-containing protein 144 N-terminal-like isoform X1 [Mandrillus leucophaeus]|uniref:CCDC144C-like coiled-coil domain-containing protein n=1 Tax=Mandrillus leucophaeus TaxID=9568 RepID=A0A2K5ZAL9_MANLE|nr:PREDICTED: putative coiled-coil domain-containing protein 144 N-terminal-like isoform X1 [Mandrillus leucophaeus]